MSYYVIKVYGLICDNCDASEEAVPRIDARDKLAAARQELSRSPSSWTYRDGKDLCAKCAAPRPNESEGEAPLEPAQSPAMRLGTAYAVDLVL